MIRSIFAQAALLVLLLTLAWHPPIAQSETLPATPLLQRFLSEDYKAPPLHWSIATDRDGRLHVGNDEGVLRYDGDRWDLIGLPGRYPARDVAMGKDGNIYVGSYDTFGWLQTTPDGETVYRELLTKAGLKGRDREVGNVWQVVATAAGVYFRSEKTLHFLDYSQRETLHWPLGENQRVLYADGDELYARIEGQGFSHFVDGRFVAEPGGAVFAQQPLLGVIHQSGWRLLVGSEGFYRADASGIRPMPGDAGAQLRGKDAYAVLALEDDSFVVGTLTGEVFRYSLDGELRERIKLGSFGVIALGTDREGGLWAATEGDLVRMSLPSPWSLISTAHGLDAAVYDFEWHQGALWLATGRGLARMQPGADGTIEMTHLPWLDLEGFSLASTTSGLLVAHREGLMVLDSGARQPRTLFQSEAESVLELVASQHDPDRIYGLGDQRLFVIDRVQGRWQLGFSLPLGGISGATLLETAPGELWMDDSRGGPQRWILDLANQALLRKETFGASQGVVLDPDFGSSIYLLDGQVHVVSGTRAFFHDGTRFIPSSSPLPGLVDRPDEIIVDETPLGTYAYTQRNMVFRAKGKDAWRPLHLGAQSPAGFQRLRYNRDGVVRVATWGGLLQFDPSVPQPETGLLALELTAVTSTDPEGLDVRHLATDTAATPAEVSSGDLMHVRFGTVSLGSRPEYRYLLQGPGLTGEWSRWAGRELSLQSATPGEYVLTAQARTASGRISAPVTYRFTVLPRWYEQWWVRLVGLLLVLALLTLAVQQFIAQRTRRYATANRHLEGRIAARTRELEEVNRQLSEMATVDALTGVANRRAMQNGLQREWIRCMDQQRPLSVLMIDVDHFKRFNDTHGHLEGDVLLHTIAQALHALHDPKLELLSRFGGEEFALLLPGMTQEDALRRAEEIRLAMQERVGEITISIGVAGFVPGPQDDSMDLLRRADAALYLAKRSGRNRVEASLEAAEDLPA